MGTTYRIPLEYDCRLKELASCRFQAKSALLHQLILNSIAFWDDLLPIARSVRSGNHSRVYVHITNTARIRFKALCRGVGMSCSDVVTELLRRQLRGLGCCNKAQSSAFHKQTNINMSSSAKHTCPTVSVCINSIIVSSIFMPPVVTPNFRFLAFDSPILICHQQIQHYIRTNHSYIHHRSSVCRYNTSSHLSLPAHYNY